MAKKTWGTKSTREFHEEFAIHAMKSARRELPSALASCSSTSAYATIRANRDIARARAHLASIGPHEGPRSRKLWGALAKVQRQVDEAGNHIAKCMRH